VRVRACVCFELRGGKRWTYVDTAVVLLRAVTSTRGRVEKGHMGSGRGQQGGKDENGSGELHCERSLEGGR